jgi:hypothetical protein
MERRSFRDVVSATAGLYRRTIYDEPVLQITIFKYMGYVRNLEYFNCFIIILLVIKKHVR